MKVYSVIGYGSYSGGQVIVAAESEADAKERAQEKASSTFGVDYLDSDVTKLPLSYHGYAGVISFFEFGE